MRISEYYKLGLTQPSLDFVDVDLERDNRLFIDPTALGLDKTEWGVRCREIIRDYFTLVITAIKDGNDELARQLLSELCEPNETFLGFSHGKPKGRGMGRKLAEKMWVALKDSEAVKTGLIKNIEDAALLVEGVSLDIISDIVTNLIREPLIEYTERQCSQYGIELQNRKTKKIWDNHKQKWVTKYMPQAIIKINNAEKKLLFVPKYIARRSLSYDAEKYFRDYIVARMQDEDAHEGLTRILKTTGEEKLPYKKDVLARRGITETSGLKKYNCKYSRIYPGVLDEYRRDRKENPERPLTHREFAEIIGTPNADLDEMLNRLMQIKPGGEGAKEYEKVIEALMGAVFYPWLSEPRAQDKINNGRKIIDITFKNIAQEDFFWWVGQHYKAPYIFVECKNYSTDIGNPEIDQLAGRFGPRRGQIGISISRKIEDRARIDALCRDAAIDGHGYIIALDDEDLKALVEEIKKGDNGDRLRLLKERFDKLTS